MIAGPVLATLREVAIRELPVVTRGNYFSSLSLGGRAYRQRVHDSLGAVLSEPLAGLCRGYRSFVNGFAVKPPSGETSELGPHRDTSMTTFGRRPSLVLWIPLADVTAETGCLRVARGSHVEMMAPRAYGLEPDTDWQMRSSEMIDVPMRVGDAVLFDGRLLHMSSGNFGPIPRVAVMSILCAEGESVAYYQLDPTDPHVLFEYGTDDAFWLRNGMRRPSEELRTPTRRWSS